MAFYQDYPFDDKHRYYRPAALVSVSMSGGEVQKKLDWLQPPSIENTADYNTLKAFGLTG